MEEPRTKEEVNALLKKLTPENQRKLLKKHQELLSTQEEQEAQKVGFDYDLLLLMIDNYNKKSDFFKDANINQKSFKKAIEASNLTFEQITRTIETLEIPPEEIDFYFFRQRSMDEFKIAPELFKACTVEPDMFQACRIETPEPKE